MNEIVMKTSHIVYTYTIVKQKIVWSCCYMMAYSVSRLYPTLSSGKVRETESHTWAPYQLWSLQF